MPRNCWLPRLLVLVSVVALWSPRSAPAQGFTLKLGATTLFAGEGNTKAVPAMTFNPAGGPNANGLPTVTLNGQQSSASVAVKVLQANSASPGNFAIPQHFQIVQTVQGLAGGGPNGGYGSDSDASSIVSFSALSTVPTSITVHSVISINYTVPFANSGGPDSSETGLTVGFGSGKSISVCTTTPYLKADNDPSSNCPVSLPSGGVTTESAAEDDGVGGYRRLRQC